MILLNDLDQCALRLRYLLALMPVPTIRLGASYHRPVIILVISLILILLLSLLAFVHWLHHNKRSSSRAREVVPILRCLRPLHSFLVVNVTGQVSTSSTGRASL